MTRPLAPPLLLFLAATALLRCNGDPKIVPAADKTGARAQGGDGGEASIPTHDGPVSGEYPVPLVEGPAPTPPMGWNSWNKLGCGNVTESKVRAVADAMVDSGMKDAGYQYINIDDCWAETTRTAEGVMQTAANKFPNGIKAIADYVHEKGLKLGIYSDRGETTCARRMASRGFELLDAQTFAEWGVDYLKYDNCDYVSPTSNEHNLDESVMRAEFELMGESLKQSGRDIVFSVCAWQFYEWAVPIGSLWRTTSDITDEWASVGPIIKSNGLKLAAYASPNHFNDPDMLEVGNGGMTTEEYRTHFGMWAVMAAPLIAGNDLSRMDEETVDILTNADVIAVDQDPLGLQGTRVRAQGDTSVWVKPLGEYGARAVALLNEGEEAASVRFTLSDVQLLGESATVRDLWAKQNLADMAESMSADVPPHGMRLFKIVAQEPLLPRGDVALGSLTWQYAANALGLPEVNTANGSSQQGDGAPISIGGAIYDQGLGVAAGSLFLYRLGKRCERFTAEIGVDDQVEGDGSVIFEVFGDEKLLYESEILKGGEPAVPIDVDVSGIYRLKLRVKSGLDGSANDIASWGNARLSCEP